MNIQILNFNTLQVTKDVVGDLFRQSHPYELRLVDQCSTEEGTSDFLSYLTDRNVEVIRNAENIEVHQVWNSFYEQKPEAEFLCFLNSDVRLPSNFVKDTVDIFRLEPKVGCVIHATNHPDYQTATLSELKYIISNKRHKKKIAQGWDFTMRRSAYTLIPEELTMLWGDDFLFGRMYQEEWQVAVALSSPIIHLRGFSFQQNNIDLNDKDCGKTWMMKNGYRRLRKRHEYSMGLPEFSKIKEVS